MVQELSDLYEARMRCKVIHQTFDQVDDCTSVALSRLEEAIRRDPEHAKLLVCVDSPDWLMDLSELAHIVGFDLEDIDGVENRLCKRGATGETSIDTIRIFNAQTYLVKHSGVDTAPPDIEVWQEAMVLSRVLGEDMPQLVHFNPTNGRIITTWFEHNMSSEPSDFTQYQPHEMVTTIIFETLIGDTDRNPGNAVSVRGAAFGHLDLTAAFAWNLPERQPSSAPAVSLLNEIRLSPSSVNEIYPGFLSALQQGRERWNNQWRPQLVRFREMVSTRPHRLDAVSDMLTDLEQRLEVAAEPVDVAQRVAGGVAPEPVVTGDWSRLIEFGALVGRVWEREHRGRLFRYFERDQAVEERLLEGGLVRIVNNVISLRDADNVVAGVRA